MATLPVPVDSSNERQHRGQIARALNQTISATTAITPQYGAAAPTTGSYALGDQVLNNAPVSGGFIGWVCVVAGTPGTWKTFGAIS